MQLLESLLPIFTFHVQLVFVFAFFFCLLHSIQSCHPIDQASLLDINDALHQSDLWRWTTSIDCCQWEGISCHQDGRVSKIELPLSNLYGHGHISPSLGNLTTLTTLDMSNNNLVGSIPQEIGNLAYLKRLHLSRNQLDGVIPSSLIYCTRLVEISLSSNSLSGDLSSLNFSSLTKLRYINLSHNHLMGVLPFQHYSSLANLNCLDLSYNYLHSGAVSFQNFSDLVNLNYLDLSHNNLFGALSLEIFSGLANLNHLDISYNHLSGTRFQNLPGLTNLSYLDLSHNHLSGALSFQNSPGLTKLNYLDLSHNHLSGVLSSINWSYLTKLNYLDLSYNNFKGDFPHSLFSCKYLTHLQVHNNQLVGVQSLPNITSLSNTHMPYLSLRNNNLSNLNGAIQSLMHFEGLIVLDLANNLLGDDNQDTDQVVMLTKSHKLQALSLRNCVLSRIPLWLSKLHELQTIDLSFNKIRGPIPIWLGSLPHLSTIDLSSNLISGRIPIELCSLPALQQDSGAPAIMDTCYSLSDYNNAIDGEYNNGVRCVPSINLSNNKLIGNIPEQIVSLYYLEILDLSYNDLLGEIPDLLYNLWFLIKLNISYNDLEGPIPSSGQSPLFNASSYGGNSRLCGVPLSTNCLVEDKGLEKLWFGIGVAFGYLTGFFGVCYSLLFSTTCRNAYFNFLIRIKDEIYVFIAIRVARYRRNQARQIN